jgi:hypothetical protein
MSVKNSSDTIENRIRDLPDCSTVPQQTAPPRTPLTAVADSIDIKLVHELNSLSPSVGKSVTRTTDCRLKLVVLNEFR